MIEVAPRISRTPDVDAMTAHEHASSVGILLHRLGHAVLEITLMRGVVDDWHLERVGVRKSRVHASQTDALDHLLYAL